MCRLIEILRQAELFAVGSRHRIDRSAMAARKRWSVNHRERRITGNALESGDHSSHFFKLRTGASAFAAGLLQCDFEFEALIFVNVSIHLLIVGRVP